MVIVALLAYWVREVISVDSLAWEEWLSISDCPCGAIVLPGPEETVVFPAQPLASWYLGRPPGGWEVSEATVL